MRLIGFSQQDILGFQITMNYLVGLHILQSFQNLDSVLHHVNFVESSEFIDLNMFVKIIRQLLECDAKMLSEHETLSNPYNVHTVFRVIVSQLFQKINLDLALLMQPLLVSNDLQSNVFPFFMIEAPEYLAKTSLT